MPFSILLCITKERPVKLPEPPKERAMPKPIEFNPNIHGALHSRLSHMIFYDTYSIELKRNTDDGI